MATRHLGLIAISLFVLVGCASAPKTADTTVQAGMSRNNLRFYFGEPLRIEPVASGGEDWYYRFVAWKVHPTSEAGTRDDFGEKTSYVAVGVSGSKETEEHPIHVAPDGFVVGPLPVGKVLKQCP